MRVGERARRDELHERLGALTGPARALVRRRVAFAGPGDPYPADLEPLVELVASGALAHAHPPGAVPG